MSYLRRPGCNLYPQAAIINYHEFSLWAASDSQAGDKDLEGGRNVTGEAGLGARFT